MEFTRHQATPELMARTGLSQNGADLNCCHPGEAFSGRCQGETAVIFECGGYLWASCDQHQEQLACALDLMPRELWERAQEEEAKSP